MGLEPTTLGLRGPCTSLLCYRPILCDDADQTHRPDNPAVSMRCLSARHESAGFCRNMDRSWPICRIRAPFLQEVLCNFADAHAKPAGLGVPAGLLDLSRSVARSACDHGSTLLDRFIRAKKNPRKLSPRGFSRVPGRDASHHSHEPSGGSDVLYAHGFLLREDGDVGRHAL